MHFKPVALVGLAACCLAPLVAAEAKTPGITPLRPWTRTAPDGAIETVTPVMVEGITISARPPVVTPTTPVPWISLKNNGAPVTVKPKVKKYGYVDKASPTYGTWFAEQTSVLPAVANGGDSAADKKQVLGAGDEDDSTAAGKKQSVIVQGKYRDGEFERLNPVIRCTPERYLHHGDLAPFCSPESLSELVGNHAYFITWYSGYFNTSKVRINLLDYDTLAVTSPDHAKETLKEFAFFTTEWIDNDLGYYYLEIDPTFFGKPFSRSVYIQIESPHEAAEDIDVEHVPLVKFLKMPKVSRSGNQRYENQTLEMAAAIPLCLLVFAIFLFIFHKCTTRAHRIGNITIGGHRAARRLRRLNRKSNKTYDRLDDAEAGAAEVKVIS
ncbi:hypothetical protein V1514DRAFT_348131 [Lipomyces japonicus]|uniref:uncharacterized protein n=1 Tax=Lipomyces japonicus TaxID=56871 RepID=UPI0034CDA796